MVANLKLVEQTPTVTIYCPPEEEHRPYATWMSDYIPEFEPDGVIPVVVFYKQEIAAMVGFSRPHFNRIEMCWASAHARWATRSNYLALMSSPFVHWGFQGITATTTRGNKRVRSILERMGWKREGTLRRAAHDGQNIMVYGLLKDEYLGLVKKWKPQAYDDYARLIEVASNGR